MNDQQTTTAMCSLEECLEQYIADCRSRVDGFVERHFSLQETIALRKQSLVSDLLCHPVNALWAIQSLFLKNVIAIPVKLGWRSGADLITRVPTGLKTRYQREIERLIATDLLEWPDRWVIGGPRRMGFSNASSSTSRWVPCSHQALFRTKL